MKELHTFRKFLAEGSFGDDKKIALQNSLTGMAKDMVEDGDLFAEYGNVTYNEDDLKDGATPEQIEAIDQIKSAVDKMIKSKKPYFLEVKVEKEDNVFPMIPTGASVSDIRLE